MCFSEAELTVLVDEILRVEPQLFGDQIQHTSMSRKTELWARIINRVNAVGTTPRTERDIRRRWHDLKAKVRKEYYRYHLTTRFTGGGSPQAPLQLFPWEEKVLAILHTEGLTGIPEGVESGKLHLTNVR